MKTNVPYIALDVIAGCNVRAYLYSDLITKYVNERFPDKTFEPPKKHWIFGHLVFRTNLYGALDFDVHECTWIYHVAPIIKIKGGGYYILDTSVSRSPIKRLDWYFLFTKHTDTIKNNEKGKITGFVTCETNTFDPQHDCLNPNFDPINDPKSKELLDYYLDIYLEK